MMMVIIIMIMMMTIKVMLMMMLTKQILSRHIPTISTLPPYDKICKDNWLNIASEKIRKLCSYNQKNPIKAGGSTAYSKMLTGVEWSGYPLDCYDY